MPVNTYWGPHFGTSFASLAACNTCLDSRDNSKYHIYLPILFHRFSSNVRLRLRAFGAQTPSELVITYMAWFRRSRRHCCLSLFAQMSVFWTKSRLLPVFTCIFALSATYFDILARRALIKSHNPMILCLSNARSGYLHFGASFVALRALIREIIPNTIHTHITHPPTWPNSNFHRLFDSGFASSALSLRLNKNTSRRLCK